MRHQVSGKKLNRNRQQRRALFDGLVKNLLTRGAIVTTMSKAKSVRVIVEKAITSAKSNTVSTKRLLAKSLGTRGAVATISDQAGRSAKRAGGYTRLTKIGARRGDNTMMVRLELVDQKPAPVKASKADKTTTQQAATKEAK